MPAAGAGLMYLEPAIRDLCEALLTGSLAKVCPAWSLEIVVNLERFTNLLVILAQGLCQSSLYRSNFNICVTVANTITQYYILINKSLSLARQSLLVVALNCRSFAPSPGIQVAARDACSRSWLDVTRASNQRAMRSPTNCQYGEGVACLVT